MKKFVEKLIDRLEEEAVEVFREPTVNDEPCSGLIPTGDKDIYLSKVKIIVNQLAEEYKDKYVRRTTLNQYMWERDTAISQLNDLGYGFGEKVGWIPCSERLPEKYSPVLVMLNNKEMCVFTLEADFEDSRQVYWEDWYGYHKKIGETIAWQPLPEPYKGEK